MALHDRFPARPGTGRILLRWFAASLLLRAAFALLLRSYEAVPIYDEDLYLACARAWAGLFRHLARGDAVPPEILAGAYGGGVWPPLHAILLSLPLALGLPGTMCLVPMLLLNAATTALVWLFARAVVPPRAATCAALLHLLSPFWINFAHLLLSENAFLFFLAAACAALARIRRPGRPASRRMAAAAGLLFGAAGLCRATVLPLLPVFLLAAALQARRRGEEPGTLNAERSTLKVGQAFLPVHEIDSVDSFDSVDKALHHHSPPTTHQPPLLRAPHLSVKRSAFSVGRFSPLSLLRALRGENTSAFSVKRSALNVFTFDAPALALGAFLLVVAPWQYWLWRHEAPHTPLLSTSAGYNLLLGNNPYIPEGHGSVWFLPDSWMARMTLLRAAGADTRDTAVDGRPAYTTFSLNRHARRLARESMRATPARLHLARAWRRLLFTFGPDLFLPRHLLHGNYPPRSFGSIAVLTLADWLFGLALLMLAVAGPFVRQAPRGWRWLLPLAAAAVSAPAIVAVGFSRLAQPALLLMLPLAGAALAAATARPAPTPGASRWRRLRWLPLLAIPPLYLQPLPVIVESHLKPCAVYLPRLAPIARFLGVRTVACDALTLRNLTDRPVLVRLACPSPASGFQVLNRPLQRALVMRLDPGADATNPRPMIVTTEPQTAPLSLEAALLTPAGDVRRRARFAPWDDPRALRVWRPTGLPGIECRWMGGALLLPRPEQVRRAGESRE